MTVRVPRARHLLVVAPHPDDEAIAAWGLMRRLQDCGARIEVLVVSDGGASHPGSPTWPRPRLVAQRRRETLRVLRTLGLTPSAITFLDLADGMLDDDHALDRPLGRAIRRRRTPDLIVGPEVTDAHADHRAVARAIAKVRRCGERRITYHIWPIQAARGARPHGLVLKHAGLAIKRRAIRSYRSQAGLITDSPTGFTMTHHHLKAFAGPVERFAVAR